VQLFTLSIKVLQHRPRQRPDSQAASLLQFKPSAKRVVVFVVGTIDGDTVVLGTGGVVLEDGTVVGDAVVLGTGVVIVVEEAIVVKVVLT
jgi:hypothetical protein